MNGSCLCKTVEFQLSYKPSLFYRCHCSLCRKQSGAGYNLATLVKSNEFRWIQGENCIASWFKPTGYRTDFCSVCGSTVPNILRDLPYVWIPVGLLDESLEMECVGDFCTDDAMPWDETRSNILHSGPVKSLSYLLECLKLKT
jgi:hypothetical protein